ncbi:MAG: hypothetical protein ACI9E1_001422 [Cryomorphaceae bacterium]|jgi:hypothetical protein
MKRFLALLLVGLFGYIAYPLFPPKLLGLSEKKDEISSELVIEPQVKPEKPLVISDRPVIEKEPEVKKIASHKMAKEVEIPEIKKEPEEEPIVKVPELDQTDFKIIITNGVETGGRIDFRKDNIISWELKEQVFSLQGSQYEGEISIEVGTLFGPELRRAKVVIKDEVISSWDWIELDE